jgi:hypothetical protein
VQRWELDALAHEMGIDDCTTVAPDGVSGVDCEGAALFVFGQEGRAAELEAMLPRLMERALLVFVVDPWMAVTRGEQERPVLRAPYDAVILTSPALAAEGIYPAIDPASRSNVAVDAEHERTRERAVADFDAVKASFAQPFFVWTHQNARLGEVSLNRPPV